MNQNNLQEKLSIAELIDAFRAALVALVPIVSRVGIRWREGENYDEWDEICTALFKSIVLDAIEATLAEQGQEPVQFVPYDMTESDYLAQVPLYVTSTTRPGQNFVFIRLTSSRALFDQVRVVPVDQNRNVIGEPVSIDKDLVSYEVRTNGILIREVEI